jgi:hypothetical protein
VAEETPGEERADPMDRRGALGCLIARTGDSDPSTCSSSQGQARLQLICLVPSRGLACVSDRVRLSSVSTENTAELQLCDCVIGHRVHDVLGQVYSKANAAPKTCLGVRGVSAKSSWSPKYGAQEAEDSTFRSIQLGLGVAEDLSPAASLGAFLGRPVLLLSTRPLFGRFACALITAQRGHPSLQGRDR